MFRRICRPELLPKARWSFGRLAVGDNAGSFVYSIFAFFWCFWPNGTPVDAISFNWAVVMFLAVAFISMVDYWGRARKSFKDPVSIVQRWRMD
jgi:hypothetical protein